MPTKKYVREGLLKFKATNPSAKKDDYRREALRLEREYALMQPTTTDVAGMDISLPREKTVK